jgi:hypothetical protein
MNATPLNVVSALLTIFGFTIVGTIVTRYSLSPVSDPPMKPNASRFKKRCPQPLEKPIAWRFFDSQIPIGSHLLLTLPQPDRKRSFTDRPPDTDGSIP